MALLLRSVHQTSPCRISTIRPVRADCETLSIEDGTMLAGKFPPKQLRMVLAWIDIHKEELMADRELAVTGEEPFRIAPLQ